MTSPTERKGKIVMVCPDADKCILIIKLKQELADSIPRAKVQRLRNDFKTLNNSHYGWQVAVLIDRELLGTGKGKK